VGAGGVDAIKKSNKNVGGGGGGGGWVKDGQCIRLTTLPISCAECL